MRNKIICIILIIVFIISLIVNIYKYEYKYKNWDGGKKLNISIIEKESQTPDKITYLGKVNDDLFLINIYFEDNQKDVNLIKERQIQELKYGDKVEATGKVVIPNTLGNIGEFNYKRYLNSKDVVGYINIYEVYNVHNFGNIFLKAIYSFKENLSIQIDDKLEYNKAQLLKSMIYGDTRNLDKEIKTNLSDIGISHITAVSGSNLNIILYILSILVYKMKRNKKIYTTLHISIIIIFCIISGLELSVVRAAIMSIICIVCSLKNIELCIEKILCITLYIMLIINPYRIFNIGMIFSFLAILGLSLFNGKIYNFLESKVMWNIKNRKVTRILCKLLSVLSITLAVNILVLPLSIYYFNKFSLMFILSNLLISGLATLINVFGIISIIVIKIPIISRICFEILSYLLALVVFLSNILNKINISFYIKSFPIFILVIYYLYIIVIYIKSKCMYKFQKKKVDKIKRTIGYILVISIFLTYIKNIFFDNYIYFFNVGQGEMAVIKKDNKCIMIDCGSITNDTSYIFQSYMNKQKVDKIDALVISHFHSDHINGIENIMKMCKIDCVIFAYPYNIDNDNYVALIDKIQKSNTRCIVVKKGDNISIGGVNISVVWPALSNITIGKEISENENANSLCVNISIQGKNYLFMGDAIKDSEGYIIEELEKQNIVDFEIIKIGHHGSKSSTSENFLQHVLPKYAIISAKKKTYNHPNSEVINLLTKYGVKIYITEKVGGIKYNL